MEFIRNGLLICCIFAVTVICSSEDAKQLSTSDPAEHEDEIVAAEDHEHHRIIIVVPKEIPHHVNHVHTYKLAGKGIPLIHSGKVIHDHRHNGKVAHEHGHTGKSVHSHKHGGAYGHQHKHLGYLGHKHSGGGHKYVGQTPQHHQAYDNQYPLLRTAAHKLHLQDQQQLHHKINEDGFLQQQGQRYQIGGGEVASAQRGGHRPVSGQVQFVPSSQPQGLGSFMPSEIQNFMDGRQYGPAAAGRQQQYQQQYGGAPANDDGNRSGGGPSAEYNVIHLQVPDQHGPNLVKHVDIDLTNNVAKLQTSGKYQPVNANYKTTVTQYNKVIGHGRAVPQTPEDELFDSNADDEDLGGGGAGGGGGSRVGGGSIAGGGDELSVEDVGYRFGEGYRLAIDSGDAAGRQYSAAQEQDDEELDDFRETADAVDDDYPADTNAYSQAYSVQKFDRI